jgi:Acyl-CoA thioesterase C-terminal domain
MPDSREAKVGPDAYLVEVDGDVVAPTRLCGGPWSPDAQHGSAVAATLAWAVEQVETPVPMRPVRFTVDLLSPVPLTPMTWSATTVKAGKRIAVIDPAVWGSGTPASVWMRLRCAVVAGQKPTPFQWLAAAADMGSQLGGYLPFDRFRTINADISVHVGRLPRTAWIGMDGIHRVSVDAIGQTTATMFDEEGLIGQMQSSVHIDRWDSR